MSPTTRGAGKRWTPNLPREKIIGVSIASISERDEHGRSARRARLSRATRLSQLTLLAIACFCSNPAIWAQTSDSQTGDANASWTATTDSQGDNVNPTRTIESHTQSGNRTLDKQTVQRRGSDGEFEFDQGIEKETLQINASTTRIITRRFGRDGNGVKTLLQVMEEERHRLPGGDANVASSTSNADANGNLQLIRRQTEETKKINKDVEETNTTVMFPSPNGGLTPAMKIQERRTRASEDTVESQTTTLRPDGAGNWQVDEIRQATARQEGKNRSTEERISRADSEGRLGEVSRAVSKESESASGDKRATVETYSIDVPGSVPDGRLHLVERATTTGRVSSTGQQSTEQQVEQPNPDDPGSGLQVTILTSDNVRPGPSGAQAMRIIQMRDANGSFGVVSVDTTKSDNVHAIQVQIAPSEQPK
jgi:hypothetical protein